MIKGHAWAASAAMVITSCGQVPGGSAGSTPVAGEHARKQDDAPPLSALRDNFTDDRSNRTGAAAIRPALMKVGEFDKAPILDFQLTSRCRTTFKTSAGTTVVDWGNVGNFAGQNIGDRVLIAINDGTGEHSISVSRTKQPEPIGDAYALVDSGLDGIANACGPS